MNGVFGCQHADAVTTSLPFPAQLSAAIVAFTIESDNAAEGRVAHRTTSHGAAGPSRSVWMASIAMWFNCVRGLADAGPLTVAELSQRLRMETNLDGMRRWGYVTIDGVGRVERGQVRPRPKPWSVLALTRRGEAVAEAWRPIPDEIERRWRERFGAEPIDRLRAALVTLVAADGRRLPDFMPIGSVYGVGIDPPPPVREEPDRVSELPLVSLLSRVLLGFALDYEQQAKLPLAVFLDGLRVIDGDGVPLRELPARAGVSKEAIAMIVKRLESAGCVVAEPIRGARRGQQARLTDDGGAKAKRAGARRCERILDAWRGRYGGDAISAVAAALEPIVGDGTSSGSPLFEGLAPPAGGWRAEVPPPERLPWFPMVLHRGGYPDGS